MYQTTTYFLLRFFILSCICFGFHWRGWFFRNVVHSDRLGVSLRGAVFSLEIANQVVRRCKLPLVVLVSALYGLVNCLVAL